MLSDAERKVVNVTSAERQQREPVLLAWRCEGFECGACFMGEATREEYEHGTAGAECPECGGRLSQEGDPCAELDELLRRDERCVGEVYR